ncbi:hypothetical protein A4G99_14745 [Haladaptatus sp. R4]|nr:hypothetical protein A4G99_14745 [Haladaptatus sp. R4]
MGETFGFEGETTLELGSSGGDWVSTPHRRVTHEYQAAPGYGGRWGIEFFERMLRARNGAATMPADLDDALEVLRVLDAVYESARTGTWESVDGA